LKENPLNTRKIGFRNAFTLIEVLVVVAIIALLISILPSTYSSLHLIAHTHSFRVSSRGTDAEIQKGHGQLNSFILFPERILCFTSQDRTLFGKYIGNLFVTEMSPSWGLGVMAVQSHDETKP